MPRREEILSNMRSALQSQDPEWDISPGTPEFKILEAVAQQLESVSRDGLLSTYHFDLDKKSGIELDLFLSLWGFYRVKAQRATGAVTFRRATISTSDVSIPVGTQVFVPAANGSPSVYFSTVSGAIIAAGSTEVTVPVEASSGGLLGNIGSYLIKGFATSLPGVTEVFNASPISGGINAESDDAFRERFRRTFMRNVSGTENQFAAIAYQESAFVSRVNTISAVERYNEQIQLAYPADVTTETPYIVIKGGTQTISGGTVTLTSTQASSLPNGEFYVASLATVNAADVVQFIHKFNKTSATTFTSVPAVPSSPSITKLKVVFPTTLQDSKYVYPVGGEIVGVNVGGGNEILAKSGANQDYEMWTLENDSTKVADAGCSLPVFYFTPTGVTRLGGPGTVIDITHEYTPIASRNNPESSVTNKLDVFVDGSDPQTIQEQINMPNTDDNVFGSTTGPTAAEFVREDGITSPSNGHLFTPLGRSPITQLGEELNVQRFINSSYVGNPRYNLENSTTYYRDEDYWLIKKTKDADALENLRGSQRATEGIEWKTPLVWKDDDNNDTYVYPKRGASETPGSSDLEAPFSLIEGTDGTLTGYYGYVMTWEVDGVESLPSAVKTINVSNKNITVRGDNRFAAYPGPYQVDPDADTKTIYRRFYRTKTTQSTSEAQQGPFYLVNIVRNNYALASWIDTRADDDLGMTQPPKTPPPNLVPLDLNYSYNSLIERVDAQMETVRLVGQDILSHQAETIPIKFNLAVVLLPNVGIVSAKNSIQTALDSFLNRKQFSGNIQLADLFSAIESVSEVDNVRLLTEEEAGNEVREINITSTSSGFTSGDTIIFNVDGYSTSSLSINESSYIIREALEALPAFNEGDTYAAPLINTLTYTGTIEHDLYVQGNDNALRIHNIVNAVPAPEFPVYLQISQFGLGNENADEIVKVVSSAKETLTNDYTASVSSKALSAGVATLTTTASHGFQLGDRITVSGVGTEFNTSNVSFPAYHTVIAKTANTVSFNVESDAEIATTAASGSITTSLGSSFRIHFVVERAQLGSKGHHYGSNVTDATTSAWIHLIGDVAVTKQLSENGKGVTYALTFLPNAFTQTNDWGYRSLTDVNGVSRISASISGDVTASDLNVRTPGHGYGLEKLASNFKTVLERFEDDMYFISSELPVLGGLDISVRARNTF